MILAGCAGTQPKNIGVHKGRLNPCPNKPNCVISDVKDTDHYIEPIRYSGDYKTALARLKTVVTSFKRTRIVTEEERYLHVEFTSLIFRFVDDVEFLITAEGDIQVRSASRVGYSDLGVNRKRIEAIRARFAEAR